MDEATDCGHLYGYGDPTAKRTRLQEIVEQRVRDVEEAKKLRSAVDLKADIEAFTKEFGPPQSLVECLSVAESSTWGLALAAEFKRASPSKGDINVDLDAAQQALEYTKVGASVLSVLTEPKWFKGTLNDLKDVREKTQRWSTERGVRRPACLRKDFVIDEYQLLEAAAHGADTALLMVSILSQTKLRALIAACRELGMEPLVEVVTSAELKVALDAGARVLGVNNRNLHTFELDKERTHQLAKELKETYSLHYGPGAETKLLALSGLSTADDVVKCRQISCSGVLVGEALMRAPDPGAAILELMGSANSDDVLPVMPGSVLVKVCGVVRSEDARAAIASGANLIGVIFAKSKRQASVDQAQAVVDAVRKFGERTDLIKRDAACDSERVLQRCGLLRKACKRTPMVVGVFMDQPLEEVVEKVRCVGCDGVQLHGGEGVEFVKDLRSKLPDSWVIKVVHLPPADDSGALDDQALNKLKDRLAEFAEVCDAMLLDTAVKGSNSGGTGATFDWKVAKRVQDEWSLPVIVAGGLTDANVGDLVSAVRPFGVDVASGVEDSPGVKNVEKTSAYVRNAKRARIEN